MNFLSGDVQRSWDDKHSTRPSLAWCSFPIWQPSSRPSGAYIGATETGEYAGSLEPSANAPEKSGWEKVSIPLGCMFAFCHSLPPIYETETQNLAIKVSTVVGEKQSAHNKRDTPKSCDCFFVCCCFPSIFFLSYVIWGFTGWTETPSALHVRVLDNTQAVCRRTFFSPPLVWKWLYFICFLFCHIHWSKTWPFRSCLRMQLWSL